MKDSKIQVSPLRNRVLERNNLYLIFLKAKKRSILIVGSGFVTEEKLRFLLKSSLDACLTIASPMFREDTISLSRQGNVTLIEDVHNKKIFERYAYCYYNYQCT